MEFINIIQFITVVVLTTTLLIAILQVRLLRKEVRDDHEWRRREKSVGFSQINSPHLRDVKHRINKQFGYIQARENPLSSQEINEACEQDGSLREDINFLLSYLENIGLCCKHNIANFIVVYDLMANTYLKYYYLFQPLIKKSQSRNPRLWSNIEWMREEIEKERRKRSEEETVMPKTGDL